MPSVSVRLRKTSNVSGRVAHDFRTRTPGYANPEREHLNAVLLGQPVEQADLRAELERLHLEHTGRRRRKDSALIWEGIITFSADADLIDRKAYDAAAKRLVAEIAARHGFNEPLWLVRHEDESRPHYHFAFANATDTAKPVRLSPSDMRQLQDLAGEIFSPLGLTRGKPKAERIEDGEPAHKWINRSVKQLHHDLPTEIEALKQRIAELEERAHKASERLEKTQAKLEQTQDENERLQKRLETYQRRLKTLQAQIDKTYDDLERLEDLQTPDEKALIASERLLKAVEALHRTQPPPSATTPEQSGLNLSEPESPKVIVRYNASVLDYGTKLVATGDGTRKQQAAAIYAEARGRNWEQIEFWGMDEAQIRWLTAAALSDGIEISFREDWAQRLYEEVRILEEVNQALSAPSDEHRGPESDF